MINLNKQGLFDAVNPVKADNKALYSVCGQIAALIATERANALIAIKQEHNAQMQEMINQEDELGPLLTIDASEADIRTRAKGLLISMINKGKMTAQFFAQFKDVFGLANASDNLDITTVDFKSMCGDCPLMDSPALPSEVA